MKKPHLLILPALILALSLGLAACGGGDDGGDEADVIKTIETAATSTNPADCQRYATQDFLEQSEFEEGAAAVKSCEEDAEEDEDDPESVDVTKVEIDGSQASAEASFVGGTFDGQTLALGLVEEDGRWKLDEIAGFAKLDQERFVAAFEKGVTNGDGALPKSVASCIGKVFSGLSKAELEEVVISGDPSQLIEIVEGCQQGGGSGSEA